LNLLDTKVTSIEEYDCQEPLILLPTHSQKLILDHDVDVGYENEFIARESVVLKLVEAAAGLPSGIYLSVKETYRPLDIQKSIFNGRVIKLRSRPEHSNLSLEQVKHLAAQFIAPPSVAGHPTGGAVDVSLLNEHQCELDMGCQYDEDETTSNGRCFSTCSDLSAIQIQNRKMLFDCMHAAGFVNYPYEWWHWSYGDKYWAAVNGLSQSLYCAK